MLGDLPDVIRPGIQVLPACVVPDVVQHELHARELATHRGHMGQCAGLASELPVQPGRREGVEAVEERGVQASVRRGHGVAEEDLPSSLEARRQFAASGAAAELGEECLHGGGTLLHRHVRDHPSDNRCRVVDHVQNPPGFGGCRPVEALHKNCLAHVHHWAVCERSPVGLLGPLAVETLALPLALGVASEPRIGEAVLALLPPPGQVDMRIDYCPPPPPRPLNFALPGVGRPPALPGAPP
mmetsp:Transcript_35664/g.94373  ORF Transcript_35664/g.94373 Transcript_35664/m.94373 type:complete len:241 (+) Transcript_35664:302-1024(+)